MRIRLIAFLVTLGLVLGPVPVFAQTRPATLQPRTTVIVASGRFVAQTGAVNTVFTYTPTADGTFEVSGDITVTAPTTCAIRLELDFTSEDNIVRAINLPLWNSNAFGITAGCGSADVWHSTAITIRAKAGVAILLKTAGTFTTVTYNADGLIKRVPGV